MARNSKAATLHQRIHSVPARLALGGAISHGAKPIELAHPGSEVDTDLKGNEAFAARILERRCLQAIFEVEPDAGYALNDAVFLPAAPKDLQAIHSALQTLLGFDMELKVVAVE